MPANDRLRERSARRGRTLRAALGNELREARLAAGVSQLHVARVAGLSQSAISRTERSHRPALSLEEAVLHAGALGMRLHVKAYPEASPVRDAAQLRLLERLRRHVDERFRWRSEVPVTSDPADRRAWDVVLDGPGVIGVEAESRLYDVQAVQRRVELKLRDGEPSIVLLLVAETRNNASVLRQHRAALASTFPLNTGPVLRALRRGQLPERSGIVVL